MEEEESLAIAEVEEDFKIMAKVEEIKAAMVDEEEISMTEEGDARTATRDADEELDITTVEEG